MRKENPTGIRFQIQNHRCQNAVRFFEVLRTNYFQTRIPYQAKQTFKCEHLIKSVSDITE